MTTSSENKPEQRKYVYDRRKYLASDNVIKIVNTVTGLGWVLLVVGGLVFSLAFPSSRDDFFRRFTGAAVSGAWNFFLLRISFAIVGIVAASSLIALLLHKTRLRRKTDKVKKSLVFLIVLSLVIFILMLLFLFDHIF